MKKIIISLSLFFAFIATGWAQPTFHITNGVANPGDQVCLDVTVDNFTNILSVESLHFTWDSTIIQFDEVRGLSLPGLAQGNFMLLGNDTLRLDWLYVNCEDDAANPGITIPDNGTVIFQLCFTVIGSYADQTTVDILDDPVPIVKRTNSNCINIGAMSTGGTITVEVNPLIFNLTDVNGNTGDLIFMEFRVDNFTEMQSAQFTFNWDPTFLLADPTVIVGDVENTSPANFNIDPVAGTLRGSWSTSDPGGPGISAPNGTLFFTVTFEILAGCGELSTDVDITPLPLAPEFVNSVNENVSIPYQVNAGTVTTNPCDPTGLQLHVDCGSQVMLNDEICVAVTVGDNFDDVSGMSFLLNWNPSILQYNRVQSVNGSLIGFNGSNFNSGNALANGILAVEWEESAGLSGNLSDGATLFEACFDVVGLGGNSPMNITTPANVQINNQPNIGINPTNCVVDVFQPSGIALTFGDGESEIGTPFCVPVSVANFVDITRFQFSMLWDETLFNFTGIQNISIPEADMTNFNTAGASSGNIFFNNWTPASPATLADETAIFEVCFEPIGNAGDCSPLEMIPLPIVPEAEDVNSNGENIGVTANVGEICTLFPEGFGIYIEETSGLWMDTTCVAVSVSSFDNITSTSFCINWDPTALDFVDVNIPGTWPGLTAANIDVQPSGTLCIDWSDAGGGSIPDNTDVLELCFALNGTADACYPITVSGEPTPVITTTNGPGSLVNEDGEICITDRYILTDVNITPVSCPGECDGAIEITVLGGQGQVGTSWQTSPPQFTPMMAQNLCEGQVSVILFDNDFPALIDTLVFDIPLSDSIPVADAGMDVQLLCDPALVLLSGSGSGVDEMDPNYTHFWDNQNITPIQGTQYFASEAGQYYFGVTYLPTGCTAIDTVFVAPADIPVIDVGDETFFGCPGDTLTVGTLNTATTDITYSWSTIAGDEAHIVPETQDGIQAQITGPGLYQLDIMDTISSCTNFAQISVLPDTIPYPIALVASDSAFLSCTNSTILNADISVNGDGVEYTWMNVAGDTLGSGQNVPAMELGNYILIATNVINECSTYDTMTVYPTSEFPELAVSSDTSITCRAESITLQAIFDENNTDYTFEWVVSGGGAIDSGENTTMPVISTPGFYEVLLTDTTTNCTANAIITVADQTSDPVAFAGLDFTLSCGTPIDTLDGTGTDTGADIFQIWTNSAGDTVAMNTVLVPISTPDTYTLYVENEATGCNASDEVTVDFDGFMPDIAMPTDTQILSCNIDTLQLAPMGITPQLDTYEFDWTGPGIIGSATDSIVTVIDEGTYYLMVTDASTMCASMDSIIVAFDTITPIVDPGENANLTCTNTTLTIGGGNTSLGDHFSYEWMNIVDGELPIPNNLINADITVAGTYQLLVMNNNNGCSASNTIIIGEDITEPDVSITDPADSLYCNRTTVDLIATVPNADNITINWMGLDGGIVTPADMLTTSVIEAGSYMVEVTNNDNGCVGRDTVAVFQDITEPVIMYLQPSAFTCMDTDKTIDATATGNPSDFSSIEWTSADGNAISPTTGSLMVAVDGPGDYILTVTNAVNGCMASQTITIDSQMDLPDADAGMDDIIECGETLSLDGNNSEAGMDYSWTTIQGTALNGDLNSLEPTTTGPGIYVIEVSNNSNGCASTDTVEITRVFPEDAATMADASICGDSTQISANLPAGTNGVWTTLSGANLTSNADNVTTVSMLDPGTSQFVWTLSASGCLDYSSDTLTLTSAAAPTAFDDQLLITATDRTNTVNVVLNDNILVSGDWITSLISPPSFGISTLENGEFTFTAGPGSEGTTTATYELCSKICPELCSTAEITITIESDGLEVEEPNTITPNGDGLNETLIFYTIANNDPANFPDNELIIFNRWGDIVYSAKPYNNDWSGLGNDGQELPQGTYYYILRLNIGKGEILRGDITIIK